MSPTLFGDYVRWNSILARNAKVLFIATPKVACTSLKWALAAAEGTLSGQVSYQAEPTIDLTIHDYSVHGMGVLGLVDDAEREAAFTSPDWIRFCVTRSPYDRVVSGWLNRVVFGMPSALSPDLDAQFGTGRDYGEAFRRFVRRLAEDQTVRADLHFAPQVDLLEVDSLPYTHVIDLAGLDDFLAFLRSSGPNRSGIVLGRSRNRSLKLNNDLLYDSASAAIIERIYADDFRRFSYPHRDFSGQPVPYPMTPNEFSLIEMTRDRADRLGEMFTLVEQQRRQLGLQRGGRYGAQQLMAAVTRRARRVRGPR